MGVYNDFKKNEISQKMSELTVLLSKLPDSIAADNNIFFPSLLLMSGENPKS